MPPEQQHALMELAGWVIAALLAGNMFFVREFMKRMERGLTDLAKAIDSHSEKLSEVDKSFTERIARLDQQINEIQRSRVRWERTKPNGWEPES